MAAPQEWRAAGLFTGRALGAGVDVVADTHRAVGGRVRRFLPPVVRSVHDLHLATANRVYSTVAMAHRVVPQVAAEGAAISGATAPTQTSSGRVLVSVLNGLKGDLVARDHPELEIPMALRVDGADVPLEQIAQVYSEASSDVVVFVHGLAEDEQAWFGGDFESDLEGDLRSDFGSETSGGFPGRLAVDAGLTPVLLRFNSGLRISENGMRLAALLDHVERQWPAPLNSLTFVGHSMGGLVIRSACEQGSQTGSRWVDKTSAVITIGTPHTGAPLEKVVNVVDWVMRRVPEAEPIGRVLAERAEGVKDLRFGSLVSEDWQGRDPDELLRNERVDVPVLPHINYHWVAGSLTEDPAHPIGRLLGDGMVRLPSASAVGTSGVHVGRTGHQKLLTSDVVYEQLLAWVVAARD